MSGTGIPLNLYSGITPLQTLSSIPVYDINSEEEGATKTKEFTNPSVIISKRSRFLQILEADPSLLGKISLVVFDDVHEVLNDEKASDELSKVLSIIR